MHPLLEQDKERIPGLLRKTVSVAEKYFNHVDAIPPGRYVSDIEKQHLPEKGIGAAATLEYFEKHYAEKIASSAGARYFGFVTGGSTPASVIGDWLVSTYDQNVCGSNDTIAPQLEHQTLYYLKQLFGLDESYYGTFVTGATMSNFVGLAQARQWVGERHGVDFSNDGLGAYPIRVISAAPHSSVIKSLAMLGIGRNAMMRPDTLPDREAVDIAKLEKMLQDAAGPVIVVANAGTVNTVDFDDLDAIGALRLKYPFWLHVDAAFGGFAAISEKYKHLVNGINHADSITIDAHKWLNVPYDAAMHFTRHKSIQLKVFQNSAAYLGDPEKSPDFFHYTPENSKRWRSLPAWFSLMAYGKEGHQEIVERNCDVAFRLGEALKKMSQFKLLAPVRMNVVCFTLNQDNLSFETIQQFLIQVRDQGKVFFTPTIYKGVPAIRAAISNWQTESRDIDLAVEVLSGIFQEMDR
ncbi:pyridoxal phosphate-dependent decarboxylase family protein [Chryseosolibacter indicus]|uniref:Aspartate aminotransferase family protein n=1 Tax=Chryseosolibacter indicus TaxID=2782351 RepID=A0ABS5VVQ9_9BACT|nr:pyridoxal-dependent decarboxylase [Chryseosolibacter indicus]MBT1705512.1 aspartate aminotransferase family protein [Chryseosolibacter indicus]